MARIVIIEDDGALRNDIADKISDWRHEAFQANDGKSGFELVTEVHPDLIICDINMPEENGFELAKRIRGSLFKYVHMPIIFITSLTDPHARIYAKDCGVDDYIAKPIDYVLLNHKICTHLQSKNSVIKKLTRYVFARPDQVVAVQAVERRVTANIPRSFGQRKSDI